MGKKLIITVLSILMLLCFSIITFESRATSPLTVTQPHEFFGTLTVDGTQLTGKNASYSIKFTKQDGSEYKDQSNKAWSEYLNSDGTAKNTFGTVSGYSGYYVYRVPIYDGTDVPNGAQVGATVYIHVYKDGQELIVVTPTPATATVGAQGDVTDLNIVVRTPIPILAMTYDSTVLAPGGTIDFGDVAFTGGGSKKYTLKFTNNGDDGTTLEIKNIALGGTGAAAYQLSSTANLSIQKGQTTNNSIDITFTPSAEQTYVAQITFKANTGVAGAQQDITINLTGKGIPEPVANFFVSNNVQQGALPFGLVKVNESKEETVTITSTGDYKLVFGQGALGGANSDQFSVTSDTCSGKTLENKNDTCQVKIKFAPTTQGAKTATLTTYTNAGKAGAGKDTPDVKLEIQLGGVGGIGDIATNPANLDFGEVLVGAQKQMQIVVQNNGNYNLSITNITLPTGYALSQQPQYPVIIAPQGTSTFTVVFSPAAAQTYAGDMTIYSDDPDTAQKKVPVTGTGITEAVAVSPTSVNFGKVILPDGTLQGAPQGCVMDQGKAKCPVEITNVSPQDLNNIALSTQGAQFSVNPTSINLGTDDNTKKQTVHVYYTPKAEKTAHTGKLTIAPPLGNPREVTLTGETNTRPDKPANLSVENNDDKLTPTLKTGAFNDPDGDTHKGTQWTIKDSATGNVVYKSSAMTQQGTYEVAYDTNNLTSFTVPKGILKYATTYKFTAQFKDSRDVESVISDEFTFTTPAKSQGVDDYGVANVATSVKDLTGATVNKIDNTNIGTLKNDKTIQSSITQIAKVDSVITAGKVVDDKGNVLANINTSDLKIVKSDGGTGKPLVVAASTGDTITMIEPIDTAGKTVDASGNKTITAIPSLTVGSISLPYGLFNIIVNVPAGATTKVVIVPPTPFAAGTKWYKVDPSDGKVKEYPNFAIDKDGNGVLTLTDNGAGDMDPTAGVIRDPGGPGVPVPGGTTGESSSKSGCFIATAAFGSYFDPYVQILRAFRDTYLLTNAIGNRFVELYYRVSPPIADFIRNSETLKATTRIMLLPAVGFSAMSLKIGFIPTLVIFMLMIAGIVFAIRKVIKRRLV